jgi:thiamine biosynthesis protein ThiS
MFSKSLNVILPYWDCSLSPNRLRFGPLIIIIFFTIDLYYMKIKNKIKIKVNGKKMLFDENIMVINLVKKLKIPLNKVAIELNKKIIDKKKIKKVKLNNNDILEIVHFIGGG